MNKLEAMELFTRVVETGSFTKAARSLRIPRATATTRLQDLERRLKVKLLHRTTRTLALTTEGSLYFEQCRRLLSELADVENSLGKANANPRGTLRIDVPVSVGRNIIAPKLPAFLERYPDLTLEVGSTDRAVDLVAEGIDCVIRGGDLHDENLVVRKLGALPVITCAAPSWLRTHGVPKSPRDVAAQHFVNFFSARTGKVFAVDFARGNERFEFSPPHRVAANDSETWLALAVAGLGLVQLPAGPAVRQLVRDGKLKRVLKDWHPEPLSVAILWPRSSHVPARVRVFIDWVTEVYEDELAQAQAFI